MRPQRDAGRGQLQQLGDVGDLAHRYTQFSGRTDWSMTNATRLMVRYTQDSWKNEAPSIQSNLWGDDPFPAVDSTWNQPSHSFVTNLTQTIGNSATNTLQFSSVATRSRSSVEG